MQNEICPITLDPLDEKPAEEIFVHNDVAFDMVALYEYLMVAPKLTNPMNRLPFTFEELKRLEGQMETVFGKDCILCGEEGNADLEEQDEQDEQEEEEEYDEDGGVRGEIDWLDDTEVISRLNTSITDVTTESNVRIIRLRVDIDMDDVPDLPPTRTTTPPPPPPPPTPIPTPATSPSSSSSSSSLSLRSLSSSLLSLVGLNEEKKEEEEQEEDEFVNITSESLPPRRTFPSVSEMYLDTGRESRIADRLSVLQYLEYDAMHLLVQILDMVYDNHFHRFVWQHTSLEVIDTVTTYLTREEDESLHTGPSEEERLEEVFTHITEPSSSSPTDYDLEVVYTECWEIYRQMIILNLERRYEETARDILNVSLNDFRTLMSSHRAHVRQRAREQDVNYDSVLEILNKVEHDLVP
jgi:hypothetical protein